MLALATVLEGRVSVSQCSFPSGEGVLRGGGACGWGKEEHGGGDWLEMRKNSWARQDNGQFLLRQTPLTPNVPVPLSRGGQHARAVQAPLQSLDGCSQSISATQDTACLVTAVTPGLDY